MFVCSLLGNYTHIPASSRLHAVQRCKLYNTMHSDSFHDWFQHLVQYCGLLVINTLRDFVIFSIESDPALLKHLQKLMNLHSFKQIVIDSMQKIRSYFNQMLSIPTSSLSLSLIHGMNDSFSCGTVFNDINKLLNGSHTSILKISYRRPNLHMYQFLLSMRKRCPLIECRDAENAADDNDKCIPLDIVTLIRPNKKRKRESMHTDSIQNIFVYVTEHQHRALKELIVRLKPFEIGIISRLLPYFSYFGIEQRTIEFIQIHINHFHDISMTTEELKKAFHQLQQYQPHAYNLLQIASEIIREIYKHDILYQLPYHTTKYQLETCQSRIPVLEQSNSLLHNSVHFVFCHVCDTIYSLLRDWHTVYIRSYKYGLRDVKVDYSNDILYCRRNKTNHKGKCSAQPLSQISLLGKMLISNGKMITLCPQLKCGQPMVIDTG